MRLQKAKKLFWRFLSILWGNAYSAVSSIIVASVIIGNIGLSEYGKFIVLQSIYLSWAQVSKPLTWQAVVKFAPGLGIINATRFALAIEKTAATNALSFVFVFIALSYLLGGIFIFGEEISIIDCVLFCLSALFLNNGAVVGYLRFLQKFNHLSCVNGVLSTAKLLLALFATDIFLYFKLCIFIDFVIWALCWLRIKKIVILDVCNEDVGEFRRFSWWGTFNLALDLPVTHADKILISYLIGLDASAAIALIRRMALIVGQISDPLHHIVMQKITRSLYAERKDEVWRLGWMMSAVLSLVGILISAIILFLFDGAEGFLFSGQLASYKYEFIGFFLLYFFGLAFIWVHPFFSISGYLFENSIVLIFANLAYLILLFVFSDLGPVGVLISFFVQVVLSIAPKIVYLRIKEKFS